MSDVVKKLKIKGSDGKFGEPILFGADAVNVKVDASGKDLETELKDYLKVNDDILGNVVSINADALQSHPASYFEVAGSAATALTDAKKYTDDSLKNFASFKTIVVEELPEVGQTGTIYFKLSPESAEQNIYDEFIWLADQSIYEQVGSTAIDLSGYITFDNSTTSTGGAVVNADTLDGKHASEFDAYGAATNAQVAAQSYADGAIDTAKISCNEYTNGKVSTKVDNDDIVNDLTTDDATKVLSAAQGKVLQDQITSNDGDISSLKSEIATLQSDVSNIYGTSDIYSLSTTYAVGDYCIYNNALWRCITACTAQTPSEGTYWTCISLKTINNVYVYDYSIAGLAITNTDNGYYYNAISFNSILPQNAKIIGAGWASNWDGGIFFVISGRSVLVECPKSFTISSSATRILRIAYIL